LNNKKIPIFINNRNRLEYLKALVDWLEQAGYKNIKVIDNDSSYQPLLKYYESFGHEVIKLKKNAGHLAIWDTGVYDTIDTPYYVYTDPDIVPVENCPSDVIEVFIKKLEQFPDIEKIGFGLKIDDLPAASGNSKKIIKWEKQFWEKKHSDFFYEGSIDTTFAVYRRAVKGGTFHYPAVKSGTRLRCLRSGEPYLARHMPWYRCNKEFTDEDRYYLEYTETLTHWTKEGYSIYWKLCQVVKWILKKSKRSRPKIFK
jgi:hypothetical protein